MLKSKLYELELRKRQEQQAKLEDSKTDIGWGHQIRSYVLDQSRIKDLRTSYEVGNTQAVLDGDLDDFISASLKQGVRSDVSEPPVHDESQVIARRAGCRELAQAAALRRRNAYPNDFRRDALAGELHAAHDGKDNASARRIAESRRGGRPNDAEARDG